MELRNSKKGFKWGDKRKMKIIKIKIIIIIKIK